MIMANINSSLPVKEYGGKGESIYFLHANGYPPDCYLPLLKKLSDTFHPVAPLMRPLWDNCPPDSLNDWDPLSNDFNDLLQSQDVKKAVFIGHSLGSVVGLRSAFKNPENFQAIILIDPVIFPKAVVYGWCLIKELGLGERMHPLIPATKQRRRSFENLDAVYQAYRQKSVFALINDENLRIMIKGMFAPADGNRVKLVYSPEWEVRIYYTGLSPETDLWKGLSDLKSPTLIIRGAKSNTFLDSTASKVRKMNPDIQVAVVEQSTHLVPLERPDDVSRLILDFLEKIK